MTPLDGSATTESRRSIITEIVLVLTITFGMSGILAVLSLIEASLAPGGVSGQTVALNTSQSAVATINFLRNILYPVRLLAWGGLGLYLLWRSGIRLTTIGLDWLTRPRSAVTDVAYGVGLAALIGIPGLALYIAGRALGLSADVVPSTLTDTWWRIPVLIITAVANAGAEEILVVAYLVTRLQRLNCPLAFIVAASAILRGSYHLYQGYGGGIGNVVMGIVFALIWLRFQRVTPLIVAHAVIDTVAFVGYALLAPWLTPLLTP